MRKGDILYLILGILSIMGIVFGIRWLINRNKETAIINNRPIEKEKITFTISPSEILSITNYNPIKESEINNNVLDEIDIKLTGNELNTSGEEYAISLIDINNVIDNYKVPLKYVISTYNLGPSNDNYFDLRNGNIQSYIYRENGIVHENKKIIVGFIPKDSMNLDGLIKIKVYIDGDRIDQEKIDLLKRKNNISLKINVEYRNGIWVNKNDFTDSNEEEKIIDSGIDTCPGCKYVYFVRKYYGTLINTKNRKKDGPFGLLGYARPVEEELKTDYHDIIDGVGKRKYFFGLKLNDERLITQAYLCVANDNVKPFCLECSDDLEKNMQILKNNGISCNNVDGEYICGKFILNSESIAYHGYGSENCSFVMTRGTVGCTDHDNMIY